MQEILWPQLKNSFPFQLCLVAEEVSGDLEEALSFASELGIEEIEFSSLWGRDFDAVSHKTLEQARGLVDKYGMSVRALLARPFKSLSLKDLSADTLEEDEDFQSHLNILKAELDAAKFLGSPLARVFTFQRKVEDGLAGKYPRPPEGGDFPEEMLEKVARGLSAACRLAEEAGIPLGLENVRSCWCDSGRNTARVLERVGSSWLKVIWDPPNAFVSGEEDCYPGGYEAVKDSTVHVHLKDAVVTNREECETEWERIGDGDVKLSEQLNALKADGYSQSISIETHWAPSKGNPASNTRRTYSGLMNLLKNLDGES